MDNVFKLKKTLFSLFLHYGDPQFFFIGAAVGRVTFRKFFQLVDDYKLNRNDALEFLALQLKIWNCRQLTDSDERLKHEDAFHSLEYLKSFTNSIKFFPFIVTLHKKNDDLKKWFAPLPDAVPPLTFHYVSLKLKYGLKAPVYVAAWWTQNFFHQVYHISPAVFDKLFNPHLQLYQDDNYQNGFFYDPLELAELEQSLLAESDSHSPPSPNDKKLFLKSLLDGRTENECQQILNLLQILTPNLDNISVTL